MLWSIKLKNITMYVIPTNIIHSMMTSQYRLISCQFCGSYDVTSDVSWCLHALLAARPSCCCSCTSVRDDTQSSCVPQWWCYSLPFSRPPVTASFLCKICACWGTDKEGRGRSRGLTSLNFSREGKFSIAHIFI